MNRRGWWMFQVGGALVLLLAGPRALHGLREDFDGPYGLEAASTEWSLQEAALVPGDRPSTKHTVDATASVSTP